MKNAPLFRYSIIPLFLFASLVSCSSVAPTIRRTSAAHPLDFVVWSADFRSDELRNSYRIKLTTQRNSITGLCILKKNNDEWLGTLINEMGAKAFDFKVTDEKCELFNVVSMMDKGYIKKTIAADLYFFILVDNPNAPFYKRLERFQQNEIRVVNYKKKQITIRQDGTVMLINKRRSLQYELRKMVELDPDKMIL